MKVYTGTGDGGKTSLFSGVRIDKSDARVAAYGDVDELNAVVGAVRSALPENDRTPELAAQLMQIQSDLFQVGALLATTPSSPSSAHLKSIDKDHIRRLEEWIDFMEDRLTSLNAFVLPGGHPSAAWAHMARTVCRRAERRVVHLAATHNLIENSAGEMLVYLNRLSDYFFVVARYCNHLAGVEDEQWRG